MRVPQEGLHLFELACTDIYHDTSLGLPLLFVWARIVLTSHQQKEKDA